MKTATTRMSRSAWGLGGGQDVDWRRHGLCAAPDSDPEDWATTSGGYVSRRNHNALELCRTCPVRAPCLDYYQRLTPRERVGVIGGGVRWDHKGRPKPTNQTERKHPWP